METINLPKEKLGQVIADVEKLVSDFENLVEDQDQIAKQRMSEIKERKVKAKTETELDNYLKSRGVKIEGL